MARTISSSMIEKPRPSRTTMDTMHGAFRERIWSDSRARRLRSSSQARLTAIRYDSREAPCDHRPGAIFVTPGNDSQAPRSAASNDGLGRLPDVSCPRLSPSRLPTLIRHTPMWPTKRKASGRDALLGRLRARALENGGRARRDAEGRSAPRRTSTPRTSPGSPSTRTSALRQAGLAFLKRYPYEAASAALFPHLASRTEAVRRQAMQALETLAGGNFLEKLQGFLGHPDPVVVHAALDHLRKNPNERALPWIAKVLTAGRRAGAAQEGLLHRRGDGLAAHGEASRSRPSTTTTRSCASGPIAVLAKYPDESHIGPLLKHCRNDSHRVQDAAIAALGPLLAKSQTLERRGPAAALRLEPEGPAARLADHRDAGARPHRRRLPAHASARPTARPRTARSRPCGSSARSSSAPFSIATQSDDPRQKPRWPASIAVTIRSPEVVPHCIRFLSGEDWWLRDRAALALAEIRTSRRCPTC